MKLFEVSSQSFCRELDKHFITLVSQSEETLRTSVAVLYRQSEKWKGTFVLKLDSYSEKEFLWYILLSFHLPKEYQALYRLELEEKIRSKVPREDRELFLAFLDPGYLKSFLLNSTRFFRTTEEFFGWLKQVRKIPQIRFRRDIDLKQIYNPINHSRIRGYRDKGSLGSQFVGDSEWRKDYLNSSQEELREISEKLYSDTAEIIKGFIE